MGVAAGPEGASKRGSSFTCSWNSVAHWWKSSEQPFTNAAAPISMRSRRAGSRGCARAGPSMRSIPTWASSSRAWSSRVCRIWMSRVSGFMGSQLPGCSSADAVISKLPSGSIRISFASR